MTDASPKGPPREAFSMLVGVCFPAVIFCILPLLKLGSMQLDSELTSDFPRILCIIQGINFCFLLIASITYVAPKGTLEEIDGPFLERYQTHENVGRFTCLNVAS